MVNIKNIIIDAWKTTSLVGEYDVPDGNQTQIAVNELNDIMYNLNLDNYMPFTRNTVTFTATGSGTLTIGSSGCDITADTPVMVQKIYCKTSQGASLNELKRVAYEDIFGFKGVETAIGIPLFFSYDRTWPNGRIVFDIIPQGGSSFIMIYNKIFNEVTVNSILDIPNEYGDLFKNMLAVTLMRRNKMDPNSIIMIEGNVSSTLDKIKRRNSVDKMITYNTGRDSALSRYYNLNSPREW